MLLFTVKYDIMVDFRSELNSSIYSICPIKQNKLMKWKWDIKIEWYGKILLYLLNAHTSYNFQIAHAFACSYILEIQVKRQKKKNKIERNLIFLFFFYCFAIITSSFLCSVFERFGFYYLDEIIQFYVYNSVMMAMWKSYSVWKTKCTV